MQELRVVGVAKIPNARADFGVRDLDHVLVPVGHGDGQRLGGVERLQARDLPVVTLLLKGQQVVVGEVDRGDVGHVHGDVEDAQDLAEHDGAVALKLEGVTVVGEVNGVAEGEHGEAVGANLESVQAGGVGAHRLDHHVVRGDVGGLVGGCLLGGVDQRQVVDLNVSGAAGLQAVAQLALTEGELHRNGALLGLQLHGLAGCRINPQEGHVVQEGVLIVVGVLTCNAIVQGLHVRIIVIVGAALVDGGHGEDRVVRNRRGLVQRGGHAHVVVLVHVLGLGVGLGGAHDDHRAVLHLAGIKGVAAVSGKGALEAVHAHLDGVFLQLIAFGGCHGEADGLALGRGQRARGVGQLVAVDGEGRVLHVDRDARHGLGSLLLNLLLGDLGRLLGDVGALGSLNDVGAVAGNLVHRRLLLNLRFRLRLGLSLGYNLLRGGRHLFGHSRVIAVALGAALVPARVRDRRGLQHHGNRQQHGQELVQTLPCCPLLALAYRCVAHLPSPPKT